MGSSQLGDKDIVTAHPRPHTGVFVSLFLPSLLGANGLLALPVHRCVVY